MAASLRAASLVSQVMNSGAPAARITQKAIFPPWRSAGYHRDAAVPQTVRLHIRTIYPFRRRAPLQPDAPLFLEYGLPLLGAVAASGVGRQIACMDAFRHRGH